MRVATHLKRYDTEMNMTRLQVLLTVAKKGRTGALVKDIVTATGHNQSTIARTLGNMAQQTVRGQKEPLNWITMEPDHEDSRRVRCVLTPRGQTVVAEIEELMQ